MVEGTSAVFSLGMVCPRKFSLTRGQISCQGLFSRGDVSLGCEAAEVVSVSSPVSRCVGTLPSDPEDYDQGVSVRSTPRIGIRASHFYCLPVYRGLPK